MTAGCVLASYLSPSSSPTALSYGTGFIYSLPQLLAEHWASHSMTRGQIRQGLVPLRPHPHSPPSLRMGPFSSTVSCYSYGARTGSTTV